MGTRALVSRLRASLQGALAVAAGAFLFAGTPAARAQCEQWLPGGGLPGVGGPTCAATWDSDGAGPIPPRLVVGGYSPIFGSTSPGYLASWDGTQWQPIGGGLNGSVWAITVAGNGDLVVAGLFSEAGGNSAAGIARWNGSSWSAMGSGIESGFPYALAALPNGDIILGGELTAVGGAAVSGIARWNGTAWDSMGGGMTSGFGPLVASLEVLPGGDLVAGGFFNTAGGIPANSIARWDGSNWSAIGTGLGQGGTVKALARLANGDLVAGGNFYEIGGAFVSLLARWNGSEWSDIGGGVDGGAPPFSYPEVRALAVTTTGDLLVGGLFDTAGQVPANSIARWNGSSWSSLGAGVTQAGPPDPSHHAAVAALAVLPGDKVGVIGTFANAGDVPAANAALWTGSAWASLGRGSDGFVRSAIRVSNGDVIVGGAFRQIDGVGARSIARWNGSTWSALGAGTDGTVYAIAQLPGGDILAGGAFATAGGAPANCLARWNGTAWSEFGGGLPVPGGVNAIMVLPNGDVLVAGGFFYNPGPQGTAVIRWNGASWSGVGEGLLGGVYALERMPNGDIVAGGNFNMWGGLPPFAIARLDGTSWVDLGSGLPGGSTVLDLHLRASGELVVAGEFTEAGGMPAASVALWNGVSWTSMGGGLEGPFPGFSRQVYAVDELPSGELVAVGNFTHSAGQEVSSIARWNGAAWSPMGLGFRNPEAPFDFTNAFAVVSRAGGEVIAGGEFMYAGGGVSPYIARWACPSSPCDPSPKWFGMPAGGGASDMVLASATFDDGSGTALYVGGAFSSIGGVTAHGLAKWNGASWTAVSVEPGAVVNALIVHDDGTGPALYVGGAFAQAGAVPASNVARWNGAAWSAVGTGTNADVRAFEIVDLDGPGGKPGRLVAGGGFTLVGATPAEHVASWNGTSWSPLGAGTNGRVFTLRAWNDGTGPALFVGGDFTSAGAAPANFIARWNGAWSTLQGGLGNFPQCMAVYNDGNGESLFVGGPFFSAGPTPAQLIARWDGTSWHPLPVEPNRAPQALGVFNDGSGAALYAGGSFTSIGPEAITGVARWNGLAWSGLSSGVTLAGDLPQVRSLAGFDIDGPGPTPAGVVAGGFFDHAGAVAVQNVAMWRGSAPGPSIAQQPSSLTLYSGQAITLSVSATGVGALSYQWRKNGTILTDGGRISGASTSALVISPAVLSDSGSYDVVIADDCGTRSSSPAALAVRCYANCDNSAGTPVLTANDFQCFLDRFAAGDPYSNCDASTGTPTLTSNDFQCFLNAFAAGCQ